MSVIFLGPIRAATLQTAKLQNSWKFGVKRLDFFGRVGCKKSFYWDIGRRNQDRMKGLNEVCASANEEGVQAFEQEALIERSVYFGDGGIQATLNSLSKWFVAALFGSILLLRHDIESLWAAMGAVVNVILSTALKKILNQERPVSTLRSDPGMPSSHAQSIFYASTFFSLSIMEWFGLNGLSIMLTGLFFLLGSFLSWLRVAQQFHTINQVIVGAVLGSIFSILWFQSWNSFMPLFLSSLWIRIVVVLGAVAFCVAFIGYVIKSWIMKER